MTLVKHQNNRRRVGASHSKLRTGKCIEKKKKKKKIGVDSLIHFDANQRLMASRFRGASRFFGAQSEFTWYVPTAVECLTY